MKNKIKFLCLIILGIQSCTKNNDGCDAPKDNYYYLTTAQLNQTPYFTNPDFDTISFASDKGDTLTFVKTKTDTSWYKENGLGSPDCGYDQNFFQTIHNTYATIKGNGIFDVKQSNRLQFSIQIQFNLDYFGFGYNEIGNKGYVNFLGDIIINGKNYTDCLFELNKNNTGVKGYLNKSFGLISTKDTVNSTNFYILK
jgi:hypothetical protein